MEPSNDLEDDIEMQAGEPEGRARSSRAFSMPNFTVSIISDISGSVRDTSTMNNKDAKQYDTSLVHL